ncbi:hypothetical protein ABT173_42335 [Streptomyces sp. NPDC001795]
MLALTGGTFGPVRGVPALPGVAVLGLLVWLQAFALILPAVTGMRRS